MAEEIFFRIEIMGKVWTFTSWQSMLDLVRALDSTCNHSMIPALALETDPRDRPDLPLPPLVPGGNASA